MSWSAPVLLGVEAVGDAGRLVVRQHRAGGAVHERGLLLLRAELEAPVRHDDAPRQRPIRFLWAGQVLRSSSAATVDGSEPLFN